MSATMSRRTFSAGSVASLLGGAIFSLPASHAAAQAGPDLASLGLPALDITVTADAFEGAPTEIEAGRYLVTATIAEGLEYGSAAFLRPPEGMAAEDFLAMVGLSGAPSPEPSPIAGASPEASASPEAEEGEEGPLPLIVYQATFAGGATGGGGATSQAVVDLPPGEWVLWANDPSAAQPPVIFTVTGEMPTDLPEPAADITVTFIDFGIMVDGALTAGEHLMHIENQGAQPHFLVLEKGPDAMTNDQIAQLLESEMSGPNATPPDVGWNPDEDLMYIMDTAVQSIATSIWVPATLEAGTYAAFCFFPTAGEGLPHAYHGMHTVFKVT